ncbi:MAG: adenylate/guanylate cyclase domain-containing protein, partial [Rhizobium sp.]|nr:adenylate/guanylate cyclase domain-containing protein [Rhizobium sp.]
MNPKPQVRPFLTDKAALRLGMVTGIIMFTFVTMHFLNHALLMVSDEAAQWALPYFKRVWQNPLGSILLYGSISVHFLLALRTLYLR